MASTNSTSTTHNETNTRSGSTTNQRSDGGSLSLARTSQTGGSLSLARTAQTGGSTHNDQSTSINQQHQRGTNTSVTGATGQVNDRTQAAYDKVMDNYTQSPQVQAAYAQLQQQLNNKPGAFSSKYTANLDNLYGQIMNRPGFSYNMNNDAMYNIYKDLYQQQGKSAMRDTVAQSAALTGGYNNSYATTAGSQAYQSYLERLNEMVPQLQQNAYNMYQDETNSMYNKANLTQSLYQQDYGQYRDQVSDWQKDRDYASNFYNNERNFDYTKYNNDRNFTASEYWNQRNAEKTATGNNESWNLGRNDTTSTGTTNNWSNSETQQHTANWSDSETQQQTANWNQSTSNTDSWSNSVTDGSQSTTSVSAGSGGSGGSGGSKGSKGGYEESNKRISTAVSGAEQKVADAYNSLSNSAKKNLENTLASGKNGMVGPYAVSTGDIYYLMQKGLI